VGNFEVSTLNGQMLHRWPPSMQG